MKKFSVIIAKAIIAFAMPIFCFAGCSKNQNENDKLKIVTTIFPEYDWVRNIVGDVENVELTLLLDNGVDLHSYQPTVQDIAKLSSADVFVYVGGESDEWVSDALKTVKNKKMLVINLLEVLGDRAKEEELVEGMQAEPEEEVEEEEEIEYDEHVWLSLRNAREFCTHIAVLLSSIDEKNAATYRANATLYDAKLSALDSKYTNAVLASKNKTLLFADRFPFRYLTDDYGLSYYAAFVGCSAETEASFKTIAFLSGKIDELNLPVVFQIESGNGKIARTIIQNTKSKNAEILTLDSMQSVTAEDIKLNVTYLGVMEQNLEILKKALQ